MRVNIVALGLASFPPWIGVRGRLQRESRFCICELSSTMWAGFSRCGAGAPRRRLFLSSTPGGRAPQNFYTAGFASPWAQRVRANRLFTRVFAKMLLRWLLTVRSLIPSE